jgi:hypothetical protein
VATLNKKYNNLLANLATSVAQGLKAKLHPRPAFTTLARSISGRRSMMAVTRGASLRQGEGTVLKGTTTTTTMTASPPSPPTSLKNPILRIFNQSESPSMTASRTHARDLTLVRYHRGFRGIQLHQSTLLPGSFGICAPHLA